jgi:hypothetical protein
VAAGCGTPSADLFVVDRSGDLPDAKLHLLVDDGGGVQCDGDERSITSKQLLRARELARDMAPLLQEGLSLPAGPNALLRFKVTGEDGTLEFSDTAAVRRPVLARLVAFTREVAMQSCGKQR